jgi:hypothetical protein
MQAEIRSFEAEVASTRIDFPLGVFFPMEFLLSHLAEVIDQEALPSK